MTGLELDNPFWASLNHRHRHLAIRVGEVARFPPEYAPFLGVANAEIDADEALDALIAPEESVYLIGPVPRVSAAWSLKSYRSLAQMVCDQTIPLIDGPEVIPLGEAQRCDVLALTALVYPHYFRPRTMNMGRNFGMYQEGRLAAMIGERMGTEAQVEMSAICTHPDFLGRGYARRLTAMLTNDTLAQGRTPFLHVSYENPRAKALYDQLGYRVRREVPFTSLRRATAD